MLTYIAWKDLSQKVASFGECVCITYPESWCWTCVCASPEKIEVLLYITYTT